MLQNHPRLCATTDGKGQFKITGNIHALPDTLLASWAGCETAKIPITNAVMKKLNIKLKAEDRDYTKIEVGCAILASRKGTERKLPGLYPKLKDTTRRITADEQVCVDAYQAFLKDQGEAIISKIISNKKLSDNEAKYRYLLHAELSARIGRSATRINKEKDKSEQKKYCNSVVTRGMESLRKGFTGEKLTSEDVENIRLHRAIQAVTNPSANLDIKFAGLAEHKKDFARAPRIGEKYPDVSFLEFDPILKSKDYSDYSSLSLTEFLRLESLAAVFSQFKTFKMDNGKLRPSSAEELKHVYAETHEKLKSLEEIIASANKPVVLCWTVFEDRTYPVQEARFGEYLRKAYQNKIEVITVSSPSPLWGDMVIDEHRYYGANPKSAPLLGKNTRLGEEDNTPARLARITKIGCMENPVISGDIFLELAGRPYTSLLIPHRPNNTLLALIDKNGIRSFAFHQTLFAVSEGYWKKNPFNFSYYHGPVSYANFEHELRALLKNDGVYSDKIMGQTLFPTYPQTQYNDHDQFEVKSIDHKKGIITAGWVKPSGRGVYPVIHRYGECEKDIDFHFKISQDTRIVLRKKAGKAYWPPYDEIKDTGFFSDLDGVEKGLAQLKELRAGDRFFAEYIINDKQTTPRRKLNDKLTKDDFLPGFNVDKYQGKLLDTVRIQNFMDGDRASGNKYYLLGRLMPLYGTVKENKNGTLSVEIDQEDILKMRGYQYWKEAGEKADLNTSERNFAANIMPVINRWAEGSDADRMYEFILDRAVRIFRNGEVKTREDVKVGDTVYITYHMWYETLHQGKCDIYPETIMASSPIKKSKKLSPGTLNSNSYPKILQSKSEFKKENI